MPPAAIPSDWDDEPISGWRIWNLSDDADDPRLLPAGSGVDPWEPMHAVEARCGVPSLLTSRHVAPDVACRCGIYASRSLEDFERPRPAWPPPTVVGTVSLWGTVIEHERGWRARFAYPARLGLVCAMCAWFEPGPGEPVVVHSFLGCAYALCSVHRGGIQVQDGRRTRPTGVEPSVLRSRLLDVYAVDPLPFASATPLFRYPRTPEPAPYIPSIRVVPIEEEGMRPRSSWTRRRRPARTQAPPQTEP